MTQIDNASPMLEINVGDILYVAAFNIGGNIVSEESSCVQFNNPVDAVLFAQRKVDEYEKKGQVIEASIVRMRITDISTL